MEIMFSVDTDIIPGILSGWMGKKIVKS